MAKRLPQRPSGSDTQRTRDADKAQDTSRFVDKHRTWGIKPHIPHIAISATAAKPRMVCKIAVEPATPSPQYPRSPTQRTGQDMAHAIGELAGMAGLQQPAKDIRWSAVGP